MKVKKVLYICFIMIGVAIIVILIHFYKYNNKSAKEIFNENINSIVEIKASTNNVGESYGTGVICDSNGLLITNAHVISYTSLSETKTFDTFEIRFATKKNYQSATLVKYDTEIDLAILKIDDVSVKYDSIKFSNKTYSTGDKVYAIGNTSNYGIGISEGIISVTEVNIIYNNVSRTVIQADIDISSGNSGGALVDKYGSLIGITTFRTKDNNGNVNYGFAYSIPIYIIKKFIGD